MKPFEFIIHTPNYDDAYGGIIALHLLCQRLNQLNYSAALWPWDVPSQPGPFDYDAGPFSDCPVVTDPRYVRDAVVLYPEVTSGNPLGGSKIARWFLHKPGYITGEKINYGKGEIYFFYNEVFNDEAINPNSDNHLRLAYLDPRYRQTNFGVRSGSCYLIKKGRNRKLDRHPPDAIQIDSLSHQEKADLFNRVECLYSYDTYTFYVVLAALCGCVPVVIPEDGVPKEKWRPSTRLAAGIAYGAEEIELAKQQRGDLLARLEEQAADEDQMVHRFVDKCRRHFSVANPSSMVRLKRRVSRLLGTRA